MAVRFSRAHSESATQESLAQCELCGLLPGAPLREPLLVARLAHDHFYAAKRAGRNRVHVAAKAGETRLVRRPCPSTSKRYVATLAR
jgi:hypothetical protein